MTGGRWPTLALALLAVSAGCLGTAAPDDEAAAATAAPEHPTTPPAFELAGTDCIEGGGHSVHPRSVAGAWDLAAAVPAPWHVADVLEDVGQQAAYSEVPDPMHPVPEEGHTWGNYHATVVCREWTFNGEPRPDLVFGYVGTRVEGPDFADGVPARTYLVTVVATNDADVLEALHAAGIHATDATAWLETDGTRLHTVLDTEHHGTYESLFTLNDLGAMPAAPTRLWWQHETSNGTFRPVALDMVHTPGGRHWGAEGQAYFSHTGTDMHGPQGGAWGHTAALAYTGFDRTITLGPAPDVELEDAYHH